MTVSERRRALRSDDAEVRRRAVVGLSSDAGEGVAELVMTALGDDDWRVRKEAVQVATDVAESLGIVEGLVGAICQGENVGLRNAALDVLETLGPRAAPQLMQAMPRVPEHARKFIVEALGEAGGDAVVDELSRAARADDPNIAGEAIEALARIGGPAAERVMRQRLSAPDSFLRMVALDGLNRIAAVVPMRELRPLLSDRLARRVALSAVGRSGDPDAVAPLMDALCDSAASTRNAAVLGLTTLMASSFELKQEIADALAVGDEGMRSGLRRVLEQTADTGASRAASQLLALARDAASVSAIMSLAVRDVLSPSTLEAFRLWGADAIEPLLRAAAQLQQPLGQAFALELASDLAALSGHSSGLLFDGVHAALCRALEHGQGPAALAAARCMTGTSRAQDAPLLVRCAVTEDDDMARALGVSLVELARREPAAVEAALADFDSTRMPASLVPVIPELGGPHAVERLQAAVTADDPATRGAAVHALASVGGDRAVELLSVALADESPDVQAQAAEALGRLCDHGAGEAAVQALVSALSSEAAHVRAAAARALGETGAAIDADILAGMLDDADVGVALAAVEALGKLDSTGHERWLLRALSHPDREVVKGALRALVDVDEPRAHEALLSALAHPAWDVRRLAAELVARHPDAAAREALERQLRVETDDLARASLRVALDRTGKAG